jgi:DNA-binding MarR family transcriptional regulator
MDNPETQDLLALRQQNIGRLFQRLARAYSESALAKSLDYGHQGLSLYHTALISNLDVEGTRITTLADRAGMTKQAMGQVVAELEARGYIQREPDPEDKRAVLIKFTDLGWQFLRDAYEIKKEIEAEYEAILGADGMATLKNLMNQLLG